MKENQGKQEWVIEPAERVSVPVSGGGAFPVRHIWCVGRNYAEHAREMGADPGLEPPLFFSKPAHAAVCGTQIPYPPLTGELHHEVELVVALKGGGANLSPAQAAEAIYGYAVGVDLTRRDVQQQAKRKGHPWDLAKGFDHAAPLGVIAPTPMEFHPGRGKIELGVNGNRRQHGELGQMIWPVAELLAVLSRQVRLSPGDLVFTGTPSGVGPLIPGDRVRAAIEGLPGLEFEITE